MSAKRPRFPSGVNWGATPRIIRPAPEESDQDTRRRPGPKPKHPDWRLEAAAFAHRFRKKKKRMPSAPEVAEHLQTKYDGWEPDEHDIGEALRFLVRE